MSLRAQNRLANMRMVQLEAIGLIDSQGFELTTIEQISACTGVSPSTIFRHFGTKENLVLWDEIDGQIEKLLIQNLKTAPPLRAFREAVSVAYADQINLDLSLRRTKLIFSTPAIWAAAAQEDRKTREELALAFAIFSGRMKPNLQDRLLAASCMSALDVALDTWQASNGKVKLVSVIDQAFDSISSF